MTLHEPMFCRSVGEPSFSSSAFESLVPDPTFA